MFFKTNQFLTYSDLHPHLMIEPKIQIFDMRCFYHIWIKKVAQIPKNSYLEMSSKQYDILLKYKLKTNLNSRVYVSLFPTRGNCYKYKSLELFARAFLLYAVNSNC